MRLSANETDRREDVWGGVHAGESILLAKRKSSMSENEREGAEWERVGESYERLALWPFRRAITSHAGAKEQSREPTIPNGIRTCGARGEAEEARSTG